MKKILLVFALIITIFLPQQIFADEITYQVPIKLTKFGEPGKESMGNNAINSFIEITENGEKSHYKLHTKKMEFMNMNGELTNFFTYETDENSKKTEAKKTKLDGDFDKLVEFSRNNNKEEKILVAIWVDAMDAIAGGGEGSGEQKAYLELDWNNSKVISQKKDEKKKETPEIKKVSSNLSSKNEITIIVNGNEITPENPPYVEKGRTMVPLRFISEALGEEVKWEKSTKSIIIGDNKAVLTLDSNEIIANGERKTIDCPATLKNSRTFVPLRAVSEILGAKIDWNGETKTVEINR